jgi:hypothetical protein
VVVLDINEERIKVGAACWHACFFGNCAVLHMDAALLAQQSQELYTCNNFAGLYSCLQQLINLTCCQTE